MQKFKFDTVFEVDETTGTIVEEKPVEPEITYTEEQYMSGMDQARMVGIEAGKIQAREEDKHAVMQTLQAIAQEMAVAKSYSAQTMKEVREQAAKLSFTIAERLGGELFKRQPQVEIENIVSACLRQLLHEPSLNVFVHPQVVGQTEIHLKDLARRVHFTSKLEVTGDPALEIAACRIEWAGGGSLFNYSELAQRIQPIVDQYCKIQYDDPIGPEFIPPPEPVNLEEEVAGDAEAAQQALHELNELSSPDDSAEPGSLDDEELARPDAELDGPDETGVIDDNAEPR